MLLSWRLPPPDKPPELTERPPVTLSLGRDSDDDDNDETEEDENDGGDKSVRILLHMSSIPANAETAAAPCLGSTWVDNRPSITELSG